MDIPTPNNLTDANLLSSPRGMEQKDLSISLFDNIYSYFTCNDNSGFFLNSVAGKPNLNNEGGSDAVGKVGGAVAFTEGDIVADDETFSAFGATSSGIVDFTIGFWVKPTSSNHTADLIQKSADGLGEFRIRIASGHIVFESEGSSQGNGSVTHSTALVGGTWYYVVCRFSTSNNPEFGISVNGGEFQSVTAQPNAVSTNFFTIATGTSSPFVGAFDEIGLWTRALALSEVATLYNGGAGYALYG